MLNPFRIRNLYFDSRDLIDRSDVVQLSAQQYDHEIQARPEAIVAYLDEDDGETITVGSSFELGQRLVEPPGRFSSWIGPFTIDSPPPLHVFDIQRSARAAEAWRKYIINYPQPPAPISVLKPEPKLEKRKQDDYQSLLSRFQVLELEVKLLKEAFKLYAIKPSLLPHQPKPSVFAQASKNSDLFPHSPPYLCQPRPEDHSQSPHVEQQTSYPMNVGFNQRRQPALYAPKHNEIDDTTPIQNHPNLSTTTSMTGPGSSGLLDSSGLGHSRPHPGGEISERDLSDQTAPRNHQGRGDLAVPQNMRQLPKALEPSTASVYSEHSRDDKTRSKSLLGPEDSPVTLSTLSISSGPSLQEMLRHLESATVSTSDLASSQPALKSLMDLEPEAEIARFPTIFQLEKDDLRSTSSKSNDTPRDSANLNVSLNRANTVTSSNPAARLLKPFDPAAEGLGVTKIHTSLPRRSDTERCRRRPFDEQSSGAGRTLWEEFERSESQAQSSAPRLNGKPELVPVNVIPTYPYSPNYRSQSLNHHHPPTFSQSHPLAPMRSAFDLSEFQRNRHEEPTSNHLQNSESASASTTTLPQRSATISDHRRSRHIQNCVRNLQEMGYRPQSRLPIYAEACDGNITKAISMAEEDEKATRATREMTEQAEKVQKCVQQLKEMGYGADAPEVELTKVAKHVGGDLVSAIEGLEGRSQHLGGLRQGWRRERPGIGMQGQLLMGGGGGGSMPGSFP